MTAHDPLRCVELLASSLHLLRRLADGGKPHEQDQHDAARIARPAAVALGLPTDDDHLAEQSIRKAITCPPKVLGPVALLTFEEIQSVLRILDHARAAAACAGELALALRDAQREAVEVSSIARDGDDEAENCRRIALEYGWDPDWLFQHGRQPEDADALAGWLHGQAKAAIEPWPLRGELADEGRAVDQRLEADPCE